MQQNVFTIFTGDDKIMNLKAVYAETGDPLDLTDCTEIDIALPKEDGTFAHLLLTAGKVTITSPSILGKFYAEITSLVSAGLNIGELQNVDVTFTISGKEFTVRYAQALSVFERG